MDGGGFAWGLDEEDNDVRGVEFFFFWYFIKTMRFCNKLGHFCQFF